MRKVEADILIETTPDKIISAFTDPEMIRGWWAVERALIEKRIGGLYTLAWNINSHGFGFVTTGIIKDYDPKKILVVGDMVYMNPEHPFFGPMILTIKTKSMHSQSELYLCQDGYQTGPDWDWYYQVVKEAWPNVVTTLKTYLEK